MLADQLQKIVKSYVDRNLFSGVVRIKRAEMTLYEGASGYASKTFRLPNQLNYRFSTGSITKMFTALAILQLVDAAKLSLDDKINRYIALDAANFDPAITIEQLLSHTSGIGEYFDTSLDDGFNKLWRQLPSHSIEKVYQMLPLVLDAKQEAAPGLRFSYSSAGYILLGMIIEAVSGTDYFDYMRRQVFAANYLNETAFIPFDIVQPNIANGYIAIKDSHNQIVGWKRNIYAVPCGGMPDMGAYTSAKDALKFLRLIRDNALLSQSLTAQWLTPRVNVSNDAICYGLGMWFVKDQEGNILKYGHSGEAPGCSAKLYHYPRHNIDLVLLSNHGLTTNELLCELERVFLNN